MDWITPTIAAGATIASSLIGSHAQTGLSWSDVRKQNRLNEMADERSLQGSKDLFAYQQTMGPQFTMRGYQQAGLNPILARDFNGSMPSFQAHATDIPIGTSTKSNNIQALLQGVQQFIAAKEAASREHLNEANAQSVVQRTEQDKQLLSFKQSLMAAQAAYANANTDKAKHEIGKIMSEQFLNLMKQGVLDSQRNVNAKQVENLQSQIDYRKKMADIAGRKDFVGYKNLFQLHFNTKAILGGLWNGAKKLFEGAPSVGGSPLPDDYLDGGYVTPYTN